MGVKLTVNFYREGDKFIAYSPALDISTYGDSFEEAKSKFEELVDIFIDETLKMGTLEEVLKGLGWKKVARPKPHWAPPVYLTTTQEEVQIPVGI
jgi:hypothetical protein